LNENGDDNQNSSSSDCSEQENLDFQRALDLVTTVEDDEVTEFPEGYQNTREENLLCSFAVIKGLSRDVIEDLLLMLKDNFCLENLVVNYRKMKRAWTLTRPLKKVTVIIPAVQKTKLGKKKKGKKSESFVAFNPDLHSLLEKIEVLKITC
jgi:hypothetical protein